jgi:hypothetical protein
MDASAAESTIANNLQGDKGKGGWGDRGARGQWSWEGPVWEVSYQGCDSAANPPSQVRDSGMKAGAGDYPSVEVSRGLGNCPT